jgi:TonB family protein
VIRGAAVLFAGLTVWTGALAEPPPGPPPPPPDFAHMPQGIPGTHDCAAYFPEELKGTDTRYTVQVGFDLDTAGVPRNVHVLVSGGAQGADDAAVACVAERWRYKPFLKDGQPVAVPGMKANIWFYAQ